MTAWSRSMTTSWLSGMHVYPRIISIFSARVTEV